MFHLIQADALRIPLADESVQMICTSPPYWGLRDYGTARWEGGSEGCDHKQGRNGSGRADGIVDNRGQRNRDGVGAMGGDCLKCGAIRIDSQLGLERTPEEYVEKIVAVFREVKRVLRPDGVCFVNLGDSYAANGLKTHGGWNGEHDSNYGTRPGIRTQQRLKDKILGNAIDLDSCGLKPKDLVGIPWRLAFALQADGWWLRSDIIWAKPNPMPESVTDRPTKSHEYIFLLTKSERYFFDQDAVREAHVRLWDETNGGSFAHAVTTENHGKTGYAHSGGYPLPNGAGRNLRSVWTIATQPFPLAHFATYPEELAERCIKAGTSEKGACAKCGAPWERVTEISRIKDPNRHTGRAAVGCNDRTDGAAPRMLAEVKTLGFQPTCSCDTDERRPCIVLDPFAGAGTTCLVADKLGRRGIGLDIKREYIEMAVRRCYDDAPLLAHMERE